MNEDYEYYAERRRLSREDNLRAVVEINRKLQTKINGDGDYPATERYFHPDDVHLYRINGT